MLYLLSAFFSPLFPAQIIFCFCVIFITALASGVSIKGREEWPTVLTLLQVELEYRNFLVFFFLNGSKWCENITCV